jgi:hypothetical protein
LYLHVAQADRAAAGASVSRGDHIGHPSCEGGSAKDAHVHLARKYNGLWLAASDPLDVDVPLDALPPEQPLRVPGPEGLDHDRILTDPVINVKR